MFNPAKIAELKAQKQLLVAESDLNRQNLVVELQRIRAGAAQIEGAMQTATRWREILTLVGSLAGGLWVTARPNPRRSWFSKIALGVQLGQRLLKFWQRFAPVTGAKSTRVSEPPRKNRGND